jgi:hypothetical protein
MDMASSIKGKIYKHWISINKISAPGDINSSREIFFFSLCKFNKTMSSQR